MLAYPPKNISRVTVGIFFFAANSIPIPAHFRLFMFSKLDDALLNPYHQMDWRPAEVPKGYKQALAQVSRQFDRDASKYESKQAPVAFL